MKNSNNVYPKKYPKKFGSSLRLESLEKRILLSGNEPFTVDITHIQYQDDVGRNIDFDFTGAVINHKEEIILPQTAYQLAADDDFSNIYWGPVDGDIAQQYDGAKATTSIAQPSSHDEVGGVVALLPDGDEGMPADDWTLQMTIGPFSGVDQIGFDYEAAVGVGSFDDVIWADIYVEWFTGTYDNVFYDHGLFIGAFVGNDFTGQEWETDPVILTGYDPTTTVIDLKAEVENGVNVSGSYRIHGEAWNNDAFELTLPSDTFYGFPEVYPFLSMYSEAGMGAGEVTEVWLERELDFGAPGSALSREYSVSVEGYELDLMNLSTPWGIYFELSDYLIGAWEGDPLDISGDGWTLTGGTDDGLNWLEIVWPNLSNSEWNALDTGTTQLVVIYEGGAFSETLDFDQIQVPDETPIITYPVHQQNDIPAQPTFIWQEWSNPTPGGGVWVGVENAQTEILHPFEDLPANTDRWTATDVLDTNTEYNLWLDFYDYDLERIDGVDVHTFAWRESNINFTTGSAPPGPDLIGSFNDISLVDIAVPGDKGKVEYLVANVGDRPALGSFTLNFFGSTNQTLDQDDILLGAVQNKPIKLNPGDEKIFKSKLQIPLDAPADDYYLLAQIVPGAPIQERDEDNNIEVTEETGSVVWQFGSVGERSKVQLKVQQTGGPLTTFSLKGAGAGRIDGGFDFDLLFLENTNLTTSITVKSKENITLNQINGDSLLLTSTVSLSKLSGKNLTLDGNVELTGALGFLQVDAIADGVQINTALSTENGTTVKANEVGNVLFDIAGLVNSFQANYFAGGRLSADEINQVKIKQGDLGADINAKTGNINSVSSAGDILGDIVAENGSILKVAAKKGNVDGANISARKDVGTVQGINLQDVIISAGNNVHKVSAKGNMNSSWILAGYDRFLGGMLGIGDGDVWAVSVKGDFDESYISAAVLPPVPDLQTVLPGVQPPYDGLGFTGNIGKVKFGGIDPHADQDFGLYAAGNILPVKVGKTTLAQTSPEFNPHFFIESFLG